VELRWLACNQGEILGFEVYPRHDGSRRGLPTCAALTGAAALRSPLDAIPHVAAKTPSLHGLSHVTPSIREPLSPSFQPQQQSAAIINRNLNRVMSSLAIDGKTRWYQPWLPMTAEGRPETKSGSGGKVCSTVNSGRYPAARQASDFVAARPCAGVGITRPRQRS
jgi:hypothetical protein